MEGSPLTDARRAVRQLPDPVFRRVLLVSVAGALATAVALWLAVGWVLETTDIIPRAWVARVLGWVGLGGDLDPDTARRWADGAVDVVLGVATLFVTLMLFPAVITAYIGLFLETIAAAVERRHYPHLPPAREQSVPEMIGTTARFLAVTVGANLLLLPFLLFPPIFPFVFYGVNGYLLSREYFELAAFRRLDVPRATTLRRRHQGQLLLAGAAVVFLLTVPVLNLAVPMLATAFMVHRFEHLRHAHGDRFLMAGETAAEGAFTPVETGGTPGETGGTPGETGGQRATGRPGDDR